MDFFIKLRAAMKRRMVVSSVEGVMPITKREIFFGYAAESSQKLPIGYIFSKSGLQMPGSKKLVL